MPETEVAFYQEDDGTVPVLDWLRALRTKDRKAFTKCVAAIRYLAAFGHELKRPHADYLRDGIYELRIRHGRVNYRVLYFFHGQNVTVAVHGLTKEKEVPARDIGRAVERKASFEQDPIVHKAMEDLSDA